MTYIVIFLFVEFAENTENLKTKMSELRLYCDLLVQQVGKTKEATTTGASSSEVKPDFSAPHAKSHQALFLCDAYSHFIPESWIVLFLRENKVKYFISAYGCR